MEDDAQVRLHNLLCDWSEADGFGRTCCYFAGFLPQRDPDIAGRCVYLRSPDGSKICRIEMAPFVEDASAWLQEGVLWHEYAHALTHLTDQGLAHGWDWLRIYLDRPGYVLANFALAFWKPFHELFGVNDDGQA